MLLGAPLGNFSDASPRLAAELARAEVIAAEDTRRLKRLMSDLDITTEARIVSYFEGNEAHRTAELIDQVSQGARLAIITDGGMPSVSDPGYRLVRAAIDSDIPVSAAPGPSAVTTALALSGLPCDRFCFEGFVPRKSGERARLFAELAEETRTMVFFESPRRVESALEAMREGFGSQRRAAMCRELTKTYEEVRRGTVEELVESVRDTPPRGEVTLVISGWEGPSAESVTSADLAAAVAQREREGHGRKPAMKLVADRYGLSRRDVYEALLEEKD